MTNSFCFMRVLLICFISLINISAFAAEPVAVIPFKMIDEHMYFELRVNGSEPLSFIFDTGASSTVLSESTARKLEIKPSSSEIAQGASGSASVRVAHGNQINFGGIKLGSISFYLLDLSHLKRRRVKLDGIIGATILNVYNVEFDYDENVIKIYHRNSFDPPKDWQAETITMDAFGIPVIDATLSLPDGKELTGKYLVDTGAGTSIKFNTPFVNENELIETLGKNRTYKTRSLNSTVTDIITTIPSYEVFGHTFTEFPARLSQVDTGVSGLRRFHGILGHSILKRFNTIYDYKNRVMYLKPNSLYDAKF